MTDGHPPATGAPTGNASVILALAWFEMISNAAGMAAAGYLYLSGTSSSTWHGPEIAFVLFGLGVIVMSASLRTVAQLRQVLLHGKEAITDPILRQIKEPKSYLFMTFMKYFIVGTSLFSSGSAITIISWL